MDPPNPGARQFTHIDLVGKVSRWVSFKQHWALDVDFLRYLGAEFSVADLAYKPAPRTVFVEQVRLTDYDRPQPIVTPEMDYRLEVAMVWAVDHFSVASSSTIRSNEETRLIIKASDCAKASPGFPYTQRGFKSKEAVLDDEAATQEIYAWVDSLSTHDVIACLFALSLKDEILKKQKVDDNQTRLFMSASILHHFACVKYFGDMSDRLMNERGTWCTAGQDFHYGGWNAMLRSLPFRHFIGLDASMYDMSLFVKLWNLFNVVLKSLCPNVPDRVRESLLSMALDCYVIDSRGNVYQKHTGNPSGWFLTLIMNTIVNYILCAYAFLCAFPEATRNEFESRVRGKLCGDDSLLNTDHETHGKYNARHIVECWRDLMITVKEPLHESEDVADIEYCGATSILYEGIYVRRPRVQKFLDCLKYTLDQDPQYRLIRAASLSNELWPLPERRILLGYCDQLVKEHPYLAKARQQVCLSDRALRCLHTGMESSSQLTEVVYTSANDHSITYIIEGTA